MKSPGPNSSATRDYIVALKNTVADPGAVAIAQGRAHGFQTGFVYRDALKGYAASLAPAARVAPPHRSSRRWSRTHGHTTRRIRYTGLSVTRFGPAPAGTTATSYTQAATRPPSRR